MITVQLPPRRAEFRHKQGSSLNLVVFCQVFQFMQMVFRGRLKGGFGLMMRGRDAARHATGKTRLIAVMVSCKYSIITGSGVHTQVSTCQSRITLPPFMISESHITLWLSYVAARARRSRLGRGSGRLVGHVCDLRHTSYVALPRYLLLFLLPHHLFHPHYGRRGLNITSGSTCHRHRALALCGFSSNDEVLQLG